MTPKEAIEILEEVKELDDTLYAYSDAYMEALEVALYALKEIQNYRKLGTLEELARAKKYIDLAKKHGTIGEMIDECAKYEEIGTVEECREAMKKQKPIEGWNSMGDDLISRSALLEIINYYYAHTPNDSPEYYAYGVVLNELKAVPTAFNKEKVLQEIDDFHTNEIRIMKYYKKNTMYIIITMENQTD